MKTNDYRNTKYCEELVDVTLKKEHLNKSIRDNHPRQKIIYNKVSDRSTDYNEQFRKIYNEKCAYCGVSMDVLPNTLFEVDHYIAESLYESKEEAGQLSNLVLSCYRCNRNKKEFPIEGKYVELLNPDNENICKIFYRDELYYIRVNDLYSGDTNIQNFYNKIDFGNQARRLDYLLLNMCGLHKEIEGTKNGGTLAECILLLTKRRNRFAKIR